MKNESDSDQFQQRLQRLELLIQQSERLSDPEARAHVREIVRALLDLHTAGLERFLNCVFLDDYDHSIIDRLISDDVISGLLLLHGLHPLGIGERLQRALDELRPELQTHGCGLEVAAVTENHLRLRLDANHEFPDSIASALRRSIEASIAALAPEIETVEIDGLELVPDFDGGARIALPVL